MDQNDKQRVQALLERISVFVQQNDALNRGSIDLQWRESALGRSGRHARVTIHPSEKWELSFSLEERRDSEGIKRDWSCVYLSLKEDLDVTKSLFTFTISPETIPRITKSRAAEPVHIPSILQIRREFLGQYVKGILKPLDTLTADERDLGGAHLYVIEFTLESVENLVEVLLKGEVSKDEMTLERWRKKEEREANVGAARSAVLSLARSQFSVVEDCLDLIGHDSNDNFELRGCDMADYQDQVNEFSKWIADNFFLTAVQLGADCLVLSPLKEEGGIVAGFLSQSVEFYVWKDGMKEKGLSRLGNTDAPSPEQSLGRDWAEREIEVVDHEECLEQQDELEYIAQFDAIMYQALVVGDKDFDSDQRIIRNTMKQKAKAIGADVVGLISSTVTRGDGITEVKKIIGAIAYRRKTKKAC